MIVVLSGGGGGAKLVEGFAGVVPPDALTVIANTGDDLEWHGLRVCPDVDIVMYTLAGRVDRERGWGIAGDSSRVVDAVEALGEDAWFRLGDLDLATAIVRTTWLRQGVTLTEATRRLCARLGVGAALLPATDDDIRTRVQTADGELAFQEYFVRRGHRDTVRGVRYAGAEAARLSPRAASALTQARLIVLAPSNPFLSIGPILAVPGMRAAIMSSRARKVAVSPILAGQALKGPAAAMMTSLGHRTDAAGVAALYRGLIDTFVLDERDRALVRDVENLGIMCDVAPTVMTDAAVKAALARRILGDGAREAG